MTLLSHILAVYATVLLGSVVWITLIGVRSIRRTHRREKQTGSMPAREMLPDAGVSVILRGYDTLKEVERWLSLDYTHYEIVLLVDFTQTPSAEALLEKYGMVRTDFMPLRELPCNQVQCVYRSRQRRYRHLLVADIQQTTPAADFNCGVCMCSYEWVIAFGKGCTPRPDLIRSLLTEYYSHDEVPVYAVGALRSGLLPRRSPRAVDFLCRMVLYGAGSGALRGKIVRGGQTPTESISTIGRFAGISILFERESLIGAGGYECDKHPDMELYHRIRAIRQRNHSSARALFTPRILVTEQDASAVESHITDICLSSKAPGAVRPTLAILLGGTTLLLIASVLTGHQEAIRISLLTLLLVYAGIVTFSALCLSVAKNLQDGNPETGLTYPSFGAILLYPFYWTRKLLFP